MTVEELDSLVAAAGSGDGSAFGRLWELLAPKVRGYVLGRGAANPDDLTSEVFLDAFRGMERFSGDGAAFKRWLFTIAHRRLVDELRARSRRGHGESYDADTDPRTSGSAEDVALGRLTAGGLQEYLDALLPEQRDVLMLRILGELSFEEVATVMGRSVDAVKGLQRRAIATLRGNEVVTRATFSSPPSIAETR